MARFTQTGSGDGSGTPGPTGPQGDPGPAGADGANGADAIWNFTGEYSGGAAYAVGDIATYDGQLWYRYNSNGGNVGDTPSPGLWNLLAAKGVDGADGNDGAQGDPGAPGADGNDGSPGLVYLGNYVSGNGYIANIAVVKGSDNNLYIATSSGGLGDPVGNTAEWAIFLPKGADGAQGPQGVSMQILGTVPTVEDLPNEGYNEINDAYIVESDGNLYIWNGSSWYDAGQIVGPQGPQGEPGLDANLDTGTTTINSYSPVWSGTGLTFTNTPTTGSYVKIGNLVIVQIDVLFTTVTNFGTGQYSLTIPFASKYHTDVYGGSVHDITNQGIDHYSLKGHLTPSSINMTIWNLASAAQDEPMTHNTPFNLAQADRFHMSFSYICE